MAINWEEIYAVKPVYVPKCWEESNSYCCTSNSEHFSFRLIEKNAAPLVYLKSEWDYCVEHGRMQKGFEDAAREIRFEYAPGRTIHIITTYCRLSGICTYPEFRPLICRLYPFFPRVSLMERKVVGYVYGSVLDQFWDALGLKHPCYLVQKKKDLCYRSIKGIEPLLVNPAVLFLFKAVEVFSDRLIVDFKKRYPELFELPPEEFFRKWEMIYLTGRAFDKDGLKNDLAGLDERVRELYGHFEL